MWSLINVSNDLHNTDVKVSYNYLNIYWLFLHFCALLFRFGCYNYFLRVCMAAVDLSICC